MKAKKLFTGVLACSMIASLAACGPSESENKKVTATLSSEDANTVASAAESALEGMTLENKTIKFFCFCLEEEEF